MRVDPAASMRLWAVEVDIDGRTITIPPLPAADWLPLLMVGDTLGLLDLGDDQDGVDDLLLAGVDMSEVETALEAAIEQAAGRPVHAATVLAMVAKHRWDVIGGELAFRGVRLDQIPLAAALDAIHFIVMRLLKPENQQRFQAALETPRRRGQATTPPDRGQAVAQFRQQVAEDGG